MLISDRKFRLPPRLGLASAVLAVLLLAGVLTASLRERAWGPIRESRPAVAFHKLEDALGQGLVVGLFGGLRVVIADLVFVGVYVNWQQKDLPRTESLIRLATTLDPDTWFFWENGASMIALDIPMWKIRELGEGNPHTVPQAVQRRIMAEQARKGIELLQEARHYFENEAEIFFDLGHIHLVRTFDQEAAAESFLRAWEEDPENYIAGRVYAAQLRKLDRPREAYAFYRRFYDSLSGEIGEDQKHRVLPKIRALEKQLGIPVRQRIPAPQ